MTYDPDRHVAVVFGGVGAAGWLNDTWTWDGSAWTQVTPSLSPPQRQMAAMVWDPALGKAMLFGGIDPRGIPLSDTWAWDGIAWTQMHPAHSPTARSPIAVAYDSSSERVILFGARKTARMSELGDTWKFDGSDWSAVGTVAPTANLATYPSIGMAWDAAYGEIALVDWNPSWSCPTCNGGGIRLWHLSGSGWTSPAYTPCGCDGNFNLMAYDPGRKRWLFYGSQSAVFSWGVTVFDGVNRSSPGEVSPHPSAAGDDMAHAYDPNSQRILVFGGNGAGVPSAALWAWDFQSWSHLAG
jgi:hypothetical protein